MEAAPPVQRSSIEMLFLEQLKSRLVAQPGRVLPSLDGVERRASVGILLRAVAYQVDVLYIKRATNPLDRWSGHVAFPGGRQEKGESDVRRYALQCLSQTVPQRETAEREIQEEVGLSVRNDFMLLGRLDDIRIDVHGSARTMVVSAFVYLMHPGRALELKLQTSEVAAVRWVPVSQLLVPRMTSLAVPLERIFGEVPLGRMLVACSRGFGVGLVVMASLILLQLTEVNFPGIELHERSGPREMKFFLWGVTLHFTSLLIPGVIQRHTDSRLANLYYATRRFWTSQPSLLRRIVRYVVPSVALITFVLLLARLLRMRRLT